MRWRPDKTGRFIQRPYYELEELDSGCEKIVTSFLLNRYGKVQYPISTNDLTILIEQEVAELDLYADLSIYGDEIQGVTDFTPGSKPRIRIAKELSEQTWRENRLRTTLSHELGHAKYHNLLKQKPQLLFSEPEQPFSHHCKKEAMITTGEVDWLEWQAGYASGAFLMPITAVRTIVREISESTNSFGAISTTSIAGRELISQLQRTFQVSEEAARVRLLKLKYLTEQPSTPSLFN